MYLSNLKSETIIDDDNYRALIDTTHRTDDYGTGYEPRDVKEDPPCSVFEPIPDKLIVPESDWPARIEDREKQRKTTNDVCKALGMWIKNQKSMPYCWVYCVTHAVEITRGMQGQKPVKLSPESVGAPVSGWRKVGGWPTRALKYGVDKGWATEASWPWGQINRSMDNDKTRAERPNYQVDEWYDDNSNSKQRRFELMVSLLLRNIPCPIALMWWSHAVLATDVVLVGRNEYGIRIRNSWGLGYGTNGTAVITGSKMYPDELCAPRLATAA